MKKTILFVAAVLTVSVSLLSCNKNSPKSISEKFLNGLFHGDYEAAKSVATDDTKKMVDMMSQFSSMMPDSVKESNKKIKVEIKDVKEDGDKATVMYSTSENPSDQKLNLVKKDGKWLVQWSKQDGMGGEGDETDEPMNDGSAGDSNSVEEPLPTTTDSSAR